MNQISISEDIIQVGEFKANLAKWLKVIKENRTSLVITQNGRASGVLISPEEYDFLLYSERFRKSVFQGMKEADAGDTLSTAEVKAVSAEKRAGRLRR